jgi:hypothetical protein
MLVDLLGDVQGASRQVTLPCRFVPGDSIGPAPAGGSA